jgi:hypothetical protein
MARQMTLLEMVQSIMSSMDFEVVNSINDLIESSQVALTIKDEYYNLLTHRDWEHLKVITRLEQVGDTDQPTKIKLPANIYRVDKIEYNRQITGDARTLYTELKWKEPEDFLKIHMSLDSSADEVEAMTLDNNTTLYVYNDRYPSYYTSFDDENLYFDSFYSTDDTTVQASKSVLYGVKEPTWTTADSFVPDLPAQQFPLLLERCRSICSKRFRQLTDEDAEKESMKQYNIMRKNQFRNKRSTKFFNWGLKR